MAGLGIDWPSSASYRVGHPTTSICVWADDTWVISPYRPSSIGDDNRFGNVIVVQRGDEDEGRIKFVSLKCNSLRLRLQPAGGKNHYCGRTPKLRHDDCSCTARAGGLPGRNEAAVLLNGFRNI
jgi:hypothetical protein